MNISTEFEKITTSVAAGSLVLLAIVLTLHAFDVEMFKGLMTFADRDSLEFALALPFLTLLYLIGSFFAVLSDIIYRFSFPVRYNRDYLILQKISRIKSEEITAEYQELRRQKSIAEACVGPFICLACASSYNVLEASSPRSIWIATFIGFSVVAALSPMFNSHLQTKMSDLAELKGNA